MSGFFKPKNKNNTPVFFCENCGAEVPEDDSVCPSCNKRFGGVKCPRCFYAGSSADFANGCPRCHYIPEKSARPDSKRPTAESQAGVLPLGFDPRRPRRRIFSSFTLVGILLIAITLVTLLYML